MMRILLVQLADIGDLILTTPALSALREAQPGAHLTLLTTRHAAPVVEGTALVNEIITFEQSAFDRATAFLQPNNLRQILSLGHYDVVVYFHHFTLKAGTLKYALIGLATRARRRIGLDNGNGWFLTERLPDEGFGAKHQAQYWLDLVGLLGAKSSPRGAQIKTGEYPPKPPEDVMWAVLGSGDWDRPPAIDFQDILDRNKRFIVIHAGSGTYSHARRWNPGKFAKVADMLAADCEVEIVLVGSQSDDSAIVRQNMESEPVDLSGFTNLSALADVLAKADVFIGAESGVMHLAAAVGTPVVAIFGPGNPDAWGPWNPGGKTLVVRSAPECSPCSYVGHSVGLRNGCPARTCMRMVTPEQVVEAAKALLNGDSVGADRDPPVRPATPVATQRVVSVSHQPTSPNRIHILGLPVDAITYDQWLDLIEVWVREGLRPSPEDEQGVRANPRHVCTINPEFMMIAQSDPNFRNILHRAALCVPDGVGLLWAAKHLGTPLPQRVTGSDGVPIIAERAAEKGWRLFLLGAAPGVADKTANILRQKHPGLHIAGTYSGSPAPEEEDEIVALVNASNADILFVAYGAPEQDKWIARNLPRLHVAMAMGVGGAFDFIAGIVPRAPQWMQRMGLEWLYRLYLQPWRIRRMLRLPRFVLAVLLRG